MIDHQTALIYTMVMVSAADRDMTDAELHAIGDIIRQVPVFRGYETQKLTRTAQECAEILSDPKGLDKAIGMIREALPDKLCETAYALACDIAAADDMVNQEELRLLEMLRHGLNVGRLQAAAIEYGVRARHIT